MNLIYKVFKNADKTLNRIVLPKFIIEKYGYSYCMEVYDDGTIKLIPVKGE